MEDRTTDELPTVKSEPRHRLRGLGIWIAIFLAAFIIAKFLLPVYAVPSGSMEPTISTGSRIVTTPPWMFIGHHSEDDLRGRIVQFHKPSWGKDDYVKRVIAVGGDTIGGCSPDGRLIRNGQPLDEPYVNNGISGCDFPSVTVPDSHVWVMGDNRENSADARTHYSPGNPDSLPSLDDIQHYVLFAF